MRHRPSFDEFVQLAKDATLVPVYRQLIGDTLTPVSAFCKIQEGDWAFLFESVVGGERRRPVQLPRLRPVPALPGLRHARADPASRAGGRRRAAGAATTPTRCGCWKRSWPPTARRTCPACRASAAAPSATPATTPSATSSACRTRRRTTAACPTCASPSTTAWSSSTTSTRPSPSSPTPTSIRGDLRAQLPARPATASIGWSSGCSRASPTCS